MKTTHDNFPACFNRKPISNSIISNIWWRLSHILLQNSYKNISGLTYWPDWCGPGLSCSWGSSWGCCHTPSQPSPSSSGHCPEIFGLWLKKPTNKNAIPCNRQNVFYNGEIKTYCCNFGFPIRPQNRSIHNMFCLH